MRGVVVTEVVEGSPAFDKGLQPGDVIKRFGQRRVENAADLAKSVAETLDRVAPACFCLWRARGANASSRSGLPRN